MSGKYSFDQPVDITSSDAAALNVTGGIRSAGVAITNTSGALQVPWASMPRNTVGQPELAQAVQKLSSGCVLGVPTRIPSPMHSRYGSSI